MKRGRLFPLLNRSKVFIWSFSGVNLFFTVINVKKRRSHLSQLHIRPSEFCMAICTLWLHLEGGQARGEKETSKTSRTRAKARKNNEEKEVKKNHSFRRCACQFLPLFLIFCFKSHSCSLDQVIDEQTTPLTMYRQVKYPFWRTSRRAATSSQRDTVQPSLMRFLFSHTFDSVRRWINDRRLKKG